VCKNYVCSLRLVEKEVFYYKEAQTKDIGTQLGVPTYESKTKLDSYQPMKLK